ncbi:MAG: trigger factor, partial [Candidatus Atribacteria bacterium]|nr:trigger factor [Candidatus Atribacteria bacterium]
KVVLDLEITSNYLNKSISTAYKDLSQKAKIPGFRKGKIPYNIIDINFGKEYVLNEAANIAISELYPKIIEESNLKPIDYPKVKINNIKEDEALDFEVTVEVEPEINLPNYKGIEVSGISEQVTEDEVQKQIDVLRSHYATLEPVDEGRKAVKRDFVILDFDGKIDGKDFEGGSAQDYTLEIGSKTLFEDFEGALIGMIKNEKKDIRLALPKNIANKELAGKNADFNIFVKEVKRKILPKVDEEFLKNFGEYKGIEDFTEYLRGKILEQKQRIRRERMVFDIVNYLVEKSKFDVPEPMISSRIDHMMEDFENELKEHKINREGYIKSLNITEEQLQNNVKQSAVREIKEYLIFNALEKAEEKNIEPGDWQIEEEAKKLLANYEKEEEKNKVSDYLKNDAGKKELSASLRRKNLFDMLIKDAKIVEVIDNKEEKSKAKRK